LRPLASKDNRRQNVQSVFELSQLKCKVIVSKPPKAQKRNSQVDFLDNFRERKKRIDERKKRSSTIHIRQFISDKPVSRFVHDISQGRETIPISAINLVDDESVAELVDTFSYTSKNVFHSSTCAVRLVLVEQFHGCNCLDRCVDAACACIQ